MTRPCRRMILHLLQIFLTLGLTFMVGSSWRRAVLARAPLAVLLLCLLRYLYR